MRNVLKYRCETTHTLSSPRGTSLSLPSPSNINKITNHSPTASQAQSFPPPPAPRPIQSTISHLAIAEPLAVEHSFVTLLEAQVLKEGVLGLVDQEAAGGHGSEKEKLGARGGDLQKPGEEGSHGAARPRVPPASHIRTHTLSPPVPHGSSASVPCYLSMSIFFVSFPPSLYLTADNFHPAPMLVPIMQLVVYYI